MKKSHATLLRILPVLLPLCTFLWTGLRGIDFGRHWDEFIHFEIVEKAADQDALLPSWYLYPSMCYWLTTALYEPEPVDAEAQPPVRRPSYYIMEGIEEPESVRVLLPVRRLFLVLTSLTILWIYLLVLRWSDSPVQALISASLLAFSWEVAYHARWIAPDAIQMQFGAAAMMFTVAACRGPGGRGYLYAAAVAAGFCCSTKYTGGIFLLPVLVAALYLTRELPLPKRLLRLGLVSLVFGLAYLVVTPGTLLEAGSFWPHVASEMDRYSKGHRGYTVEPPLAHLGKMLQYFGGAVGSPYRWLSFAVAGLAVVGIYRVVVDRSRWLSVSLLIVPLLLLLFMSRQRVMIVRNLLSLAPFLAIFAGLGAGWLLSRSRPRALRYATMALVVLILGANVRWSFIAAESIVDRRSDRFVRELDEYVGASPEQTFFLTPPVLEDLKKAGLEPRSNITPTDFAGCDVVVGYPNHIHPLREWPANDPGLALRTFGPLEVNFDYYPTYLHPRIVLLTLERTKEVKGL